MTATALTEAENLTASISWRGHPRTSNSGRRTNEPVEVEFKETGRIPVLHPERRYGAPTAVSGGAKTMRYCLPHGEAKLRAITHEILRRHLWPTLLWPTSVELRSVFRAPAPRPAPAAGAGIAHPQSWFEKNNKEEDA